MQQINGALLWLVTHTRPDMAWGLSLFASILARDLREAEYRAKHLLQYLQEFPEVGLVYRRLSQAEANVHRLFSDISWAPTGRNSQEASLQYVGARDCNLVSWHSSKQPLTAESTCESELIGATSALHRAYPLLLLAQEVTQHKAFIALGVDNLPAIRQLRLGDDGSFRTRHISIRGYRLSEAVNNGLVELSHVSTADIPADHLTKALSGQDMPIARSRLGLRIL